MNNDILTKKSQDNKQNLNINNKILKKNLLLNKSNKSLILLIKIYFIIMWLLFIVIIIFSIYKIKYSMSCAVKYNNFFTDFSAITNRYQILYYYFNAIRTLLIYPDDERKKNMKLLWKDLKIIMKKKIQNF